MRLCLTQAAPCERGSWVHACAAVSTQKHQLLIMLHSFFHAIALGIVNQHSVKAQEEWRTGACRILSQPCCWYV